MRIRKYPLGAFIVLILASGYLGLAPVKIPTIKQSDKVLHFLTFFLLTICFYWILETNRRRNLQLTIFVCTFVLGVGSEILQGLLPNERDFDPWDIGANILGSLAGVLLSTWYHKRMLERKRKAKGYSSVPGEEDLELGESSGEQESGVTGSGQQTQEEEGGSWDENPQEWDEDEHDAEENNAKKAAQSSSQQEDATESKQRND